MVLERKNKASNWKEYTCELTRLLDKLASIHKKEYYYIFHHYLLSDEWHIKNKCISIRVPGGTVGVIYYDDDFKITELKVDTDYVVKTYPKTVNEIIQKYIGEQIEFKEGGIDE